MFKNKKALLLLFTVALAVILSGCISSQQKLQRQAQEGNRSAQAMLGESYLRGYFSSINYVAAKRWAQQGAYGNRPLALFVMGELYRHGYGDTDPNYTLAIDYYQRSLPQLRKLASENNIHAAYNLGLLYKSGIVVKKDYGKTISYFRRGIHRNFAPAINQLGICYRDGIGVKQNQSRASHYFLKAAMKDYPPAQYNLALQYFKQKNLHPGLKWLNCAVDAEYPPAITKLADRQQNASKKSANKQKVIALYRHAALTGYPEAQFKLAKLMRDKQNLPEAAKWLLKAVERSYIPAMLTLAQLNADGKPVRSLILLELAANNGGKVSAKLINELDRKTGMYLIINSIWHGIDKGELYLKYDSAMQRVIRGYKAGIGSGSHDLFLKELKSSPVKFYLNCDWQLIFQHRLPVSWSGEIFEHAPKEFHRTPAFWLTYATCANYAGRGAIAMYAAHKLTIAAKKLPASPDKNNLLHLAAVIKCNALVLLGHDNDAYDMLFRHGKLPQSAGLTNYINHWALPALKDRKKFIAATGLKASDLATFSKLPVKTSFYNMQNNKIKTVSQPQFKAPAVQ
jgi:TPR repeat protein